MVVGECYVGTVGSMTPQFARQYTERGAAAGPEVFILNTDIHGHIKVGGV